MGSSSWAWVCWCPCVVYDKLANSGLWDKVGLPSTFVKFYWETATPFICALSVAVWGLHGGFTVTESIWSRKPKILSENTTQKDSADLWCTQSTNSKFCMCVGRVGVGWSCRVLERLLEFIPMRWEWPRWNVIASACGRSRFSSPCLGWWSFSVVHPYLSIQHSSIKCTF